MKKIGRVLLILNIVAGIVAFTNEGFKKYIVVCPYRPHQRNANCSIGMANGDSFTFSFSANLSTYNLSHGCNLSLVNLDTFMPSGKREGFMAIVVSIEGACNASISNIQYSPQSNEVQMYKPVQVENKTESYQLINMCIQHCQCIIITHLTTNLQFYIEPPANSDVVYRTKNQSGNLRVTRYSPENTTVAFLYLGSQQNTLNDVILRGTGYGFVAVFCGSVNKPHLLSQISPRIFFNLRQTVNSKFDISHSKIRGRFFLMSVNKSTTGKIKFSGKGQSVIFLQGEIKTVKLIVHTGISCLQAPSSVHIALGIVNNCTGTPHALFNNSLLMCTEVFYNRVEPNRTGSNNGIIPYPMQYTECLRERQQTHDALRTSVSSITAGNTISALSTSHLTILQIQASYHNAGSSFPTTDHLETLQTGHEITIGTNKLTAKVRATPFLIDVTGSLEQELSPQRKDQASLLIYGRRIFSSQMRSSVNGNTRSMFESSNGVLQTGNMKTSQTYTGHRSLINPSCTNTNTDVLLVLQQSDNVPFDPASDVFITTVQTLDAIRTPTLVPKYTSLSLSVHQSTLSDSISTDTDVSSTEMPQLNFIQSTHTSTTQLIRPTTVIESNMARSSMMPQKDSCECQSTPCTDGDVNSAVFDTTSEAFKEELEALKKSLKVDKSKLSSTWNKLNSAYDRRSSSAKLGYLGIAVLFGAIGFIMFLDFGALLFNAKNTCTHCTKPGTQHRKACKNHRRGSLIKLLPGKVRHSRNRVSSIEEDNNV